MAHPPVLAPVLAGGALATSAVAAKTLQWRGCGITKLAVTGAPSARKRDVKIIGIEPTPENIASGNHPSYRPLYLTVPRDPAVERFVELTLSDEGQRIIRKQKNGEPGNGQSPG